jgi:hypothetical protein
VSSDREDTIEVIEEAPVAPRSERTEISSHPKERVVATEVKALTAKVGERPALMTATPNQLAHEKANASANTQMKVLTDLVKLLVRTIEEQKEEHANQLEMLTKTFTQQIETLKAQVTELTEEIFKELQKLVIHPEMLLEIVSQKSKM